MIILLLCILVNSAEIKSHLSIVNQTATRIQYVGNLFNVTVDSNPIHRPNCSNNSCMLATNMNCSVFGESCNVINTVAYVDFTDYEIVMVSNTIRPLNYFDSMYANNGIVFYCIYDLHLDTVYDSLNYLMIFKQEATMSCVMFNYDINVSMYDQEIRFYSHLISNSNTRCIYPLMTNGIRVIPFDINDGKTIYQDCGSIGYTAGRDVLTCYNHGYCQDDN